MPGGDRTGPQGLGPKTGRAAGYCAGFPQPGCANPVHSDFGRGLGFGRGGGRGRRNRFFATGLPGWMRFGGNVPMNPAASPEMELQGLKQQAASLQSTLDQVNERLNELQEKAL